MKTYSLFALTILPLFAAGCAAPSSPVGSPMPSASVPVGAPSAPTSPPATSPTATSSATALPVIDTTWKTYTNSALKFSFQWPTRGRYAPTWGVTFLKGSDVKTSGCTSTLTVNGFSFCHVATEDAGAGSRYFLDTYDTQIDSTIVRITFKKQATLAAIVDLPKCPKEGLLVPAAGCVPFDLTAYRAHLDQVVSTFQKH